MNKHYSELFEKKIKIQRRIKSSEDRNTFDGVFDNRTLLAFYTLFNNNVLDYLDYTISTGKEAHVFKGVKGKKSYAVKVYRLTTANFKSIIKYINGDVRFEKIKKTHDNIIYLWAQKEFQNLKLMRQYKLSVPMPIYFYKNILIMQYLGYVTGQAPLLKYVSLPDATRVFEQIKTAIVTLANKAKLVHGDLSEYNIMYYRKKPYFIDVGQAVPVSHPLSKQLLLRDIHNIVKYFNKYDIQVTEKQILKDITVYKD